jgi:hypothetical protein
VFEKSVVDPGSEVQDGKKLGSRKNVQDPSQRLQLTNLIA